MMTPLLFIASIIYYHLRMDGPPRESEPISRRPRRRPLDAAQDVILEVLLDDGALLTLHLSGVQRVSTRFEPTWAQTLEVGLVARDEPDGPFRTVARVEVPDLVGHLLEHLPGVVFIEAEGAPATPKAGAPATHASRGPRSLS